MVCSEMESQNRSEHLDCELFEGKQLEAEESEARWNHCTKNPGHSKFIPVHDFKQFYLPKVPRIEGHKYLRACIDLTVRLRVHYTSLDRPDDDGFAIARGSGRLRTGTGFIWHVGVPDFYTPCPCAECYEKFVNIYYRFEVRTARHLVYNTEEARATAVDLFCDDESCERDGNMKSVLGLEVIESNAHTDVCALSCVTHDRRLGLRVYDAWTLYHTECKPLSVSDLEPALPVNPMSEPALIISHPHGQPKQITIGEWRQKDEDYPRYQYTTPTCPGSSGAPVVIYRQQVSYKFLSDLVLSPVHSGSESSASTDLEDQLNFGFDWKKNMSQ